MSVKYEVRELKKRDTVKLINEQIIESDKEIEASRKHIHDLLYRKNEKSKKNNGTLA
ncbi:hypothetical protein [Chengkuizengella axinellae]|uniref:FbpB family small basic protein n=1 Tax=Chengkuizengella axinellae TaxID=3064388 RepID=A0ABT9J407_9BACL|nr:hypothetical protein [Chengkuizengella sp. 2205SS18-9]MDP5276208.1 hypothetical protein [Chengkuizengella sp. 2205SS18-9]